MNAIDILILNTFSAAFDLRYGIRHYKKFLAMYSYIWDSLYIKEEQFVEFLKCNWINLSFSYFCAKIRSYEVTTS